MRAIQILSNLLPELRSLCETTTACSAGKWRVRQERIPAPSGGDWCFSTINGNPKRGNGILNNEIYVGKIVWNRQRFVKEPDTGMRQARPNPEAQWVIQEAPELRIIDDDLWQAVKARQQENKIERDDHGRANVSAIKSRRRPKYLFSGLTKCACCGGGYSAI
ncbi:recombinase family protein [Mesorhizobium silamurunense]|uniref:recombinase family protein n=1 Tax=Mesorhizobium silamurunense TaxID=499528 RepID=UPI0028AD539A|nr:recombinase family protein [Mesorhizobium silamurunense]